MSTEFDEESNLHTVEMQFIVLNLLFHEHLLSYSGWLRNNLGHVRGYARGTIPETRFAILEKLKTNVTLASRNESIKAIEKCWKCPYVLFRHPHNTLAGSPHRRYSMNYSIRTYGDVNWKYTCGHFCDAVGPQGSTLWPF